MPVLLDNSPLPPELQKRQAVDMGTVLDQWVKRNTGTDGVAYAPVYASELGQALINYLSGQGDLGVLNDLDTFDIHCALTEIGRPLDLGRYLAWRGEGVPAPLRHIYSE